MKSATEVLDAINRLEREFPVQSWRAKDIDLWPSYRMRLFMNVTLGILSQGSSEQGGRRLIALAMRGLRSIWRVPLGAWRDRGMNSKPEPGMTAVFLSDGLSFTRVSDRWYDRIVDPLVFALLERGQSALKLTPLSHVHVPRAAPSRFIQPSIDRIKLLAPLRHIDAVLPMFAEFQREAQRVFFEQVPSRDWLLSHAKRLDALAEWFARMFARTGATRSFVNNYYSLEGMAFVVGSRRAGMRCADLQHGLQGDLHAAYGRWVDVPSGGYSTLPDEFWVWSDSEAIAINAWRGQSESHVPRVTGNPWKDRWSDETDPLAGHYATQARKLRSESAGTTQVLVILSWGLATEETDKIIRAAKLAGPGVAWWWRLHPVEADRCHEFSAVLKNQGLDASQVTAATTLPLFALIRSADVIVAHSSTVIQEAASVGIPSIITSDYGAELHAALIASGMAVKATADAAIAQQTRLLTQHKPALITVPTQQASALNRALNEVLPLSERRPNCRNVRGAES